MLYLTLRQLQYVVAVAKVGSLSKAAQDMNVSQPALSVAITQVEDRLRKKLFIRRKGASIRLTSFAPEFLKEAEDLLIRAARLEDPKAAANHQLQRVTVGCFEDLAPQYLALVMGQLRKQFPDVELIPHVANFSALAEGLRDGPVDLAITYDLGLDASYQKQPLTKVSPYAFFSPDNQLAKRSSVSLRELESKPLILFEEGHSVRHMLALFHAQQLHPRVAHRVSSLEVMRSFAANGEGIGISYGNPPSDISYDGKPLAKLRISDPEALEPIILARSDLSTASNPVPSILEHMSGLACFNVG